MQRRPRRQFRMNRWVPLAAPLMRGVRRLNEEWRRHMRAILLLSLVCVAAPSFGAEQKPAPLSDWFQEDHVAVEIRVPHEAVYSKTEILRAPAGELQIDVESTDGKQTQKGTILLVSGPWMVTKGLQLERGYEIDVIDGAVLQAQLPIQLLSRAFQRGPASVAARQAVDVKEATEAIHISTLQLGPGGNSWSGAEATYPAPWKLSGVVQRIRPELVQYDLTFSFSAEGSVQSVQISGKLENLSAAFQLPDTFSLLGWKVDRLGPYTETTTNGTIADDGAKPASESFKTLGDLRKNHGSPVMRDKSLVQMPHYTFTAPADQGWQMERGAQHEEEVILTKEVGPIVVRMAFLMILVPDSMRSRAAEVVADDFRELEERGMLEQGVQPGLYQLNNLVKGERTLGDRVFYTMTCETVGTSPGRYQSQSAALYLLFPKSENNDWFIVAHYSESTQHSKQPDKSYKVDKSYKADFEALLQGMVLR
jgi:hypothetical protein